MSRHRLRAKLASLACALTLAGCAAQSFQPTFKTPARPEPEQIAKELAAVEPRAQSAMIVALTQDGKLVAWELGALEKGALWEREVDAKSAPLIAGNSVVMAEGDAIVVRDLASGAVRTTLGDEMQLVGADGDGDAVVIAMAPRDDASEKGAIAYVRGGRVRWTQELNLAVGTPALVRGYVLVPWATHRLSVLDVNDGAELARWHFNGAVLGHVRVEGDGVYVGQLGLLRLRGDLLELNVNELQAVAPLPRALPGQPPMLADGYAPVPEPDSAYHHVRLDFALGAGDAIADDALYARFYRIVFDLVASEDRVRAVHVLPRDVVGAAATRDGLLAADEAGTLRVLQHDGRAHAIAELGKLLTVATLRAGGWTLSSTAAPVVGTPQATAAQATAAQAAPAQATPALSLDAQLHAAAVLDDSRLAAGRAYAVEKLAVSPAAEVTSQLVAICVAAASPESVRRKACDMLDGRSSGGDAVLAALKGAQGKQARTSALAKAAASMQLRPAAALLLPQVLDPRTDPAELAVLITALATLGHQPAAPTIDRFLRLHHAEPEASELLPALHAAASALATLRAKPYRDTLVMIGSDGLTPEPLRKSANDAVIALDTPPKPAQREQPAAPAEPAPPPAPVPDTRPRYLSAELVDAALRPVRKQLAKCLSTAPDAPTSARIAMVVGPTGVVESAYVAPGTLQICIEALVLPQRFPETQQGRQSITHVVRLAPAKGKAAKPAGKTGKKSTRASAPKPQTP